MSILTSLEERQAPSPAPAIPPLPPSARMPAGRAIAVLFLTFAIASLLCAESLHKLAEEQPFGARRDLALDVTDPLVRVSRFLSLDRPRQWLAGASGHDDLREPEVALPTPSTVPPPAPTSTAPREDATATTASTTSTATTVAAPPTTLVPERRVPTPEQPLRVLLAGDSLIGNVSDQFASLVRNDPRIQITSDVRVSSGLARPDYFNWPVELTTMLQAQAADVVVLLFGANDDQDMIEANGTRAAIGTDEWRAEYQRRVAQMMDVAAAGGRTVVWLAMPAVAPARLNAAKDVMNDLAHLEASVRPTVHVVDTAPLLAPPGGGYADFLTLPDGNVVKVRENDGVHLTHTGCDLVTPSILGAFAVEWHLVPDPSPPTTTPPPAPPSTTAPPP
jgi:hypothetical protein